MVIVQAGGDAEKRRDFFFPYIRREAAVLRYSISQDMLSGVLTGSMKMMNMDEGGSRKPGYGGGSSGGYGGGNQGNGNRSRVERDQQNRPLLPCPLSCTHTVPYGSATYCSNFRKDS
jgi:hypothetical protein